MTVFDEVAILCDNAGEAAAKLALADTKKKDSALLCISEALLADCDKIISANAEDIERARENGVPSAMLDRLTLDRTRIEGICKSVRDVAALEDPGGKSESWSRPSGINISRVRVPIGVVAIIY